MWSHLLRPRHHASDAVALSRQRDRNPTFAPSEEGTIARILVVDDEESVRLLLCDALELAGHETVGASHGLEALTMTRAQRVDLILLDVNMPMADGYEVLDRLRESGNTTPVIMLTARQGSEDTKRGFTLGADDFIRKPFRLEEVILRVDAVLRRTLPQVEPSSIQVGGLILSPSRHEVTVDGVAIELSPTEFRLLEHLMANVGRVLTRGQLLRDVWDYPADSETKLVETYVSYVRRKVGDAVIIRTVRGVGYQLVDGRV